MFKTIPVLAALAAVAVIAPAANAAPSSATPYQRVQLGEKKADVQRHLGSGSVLLRGVGNQYGETLYKSYPNAAGSVDIVEYFRPASGGAFLVVDKKTCTGTVGADDLECAF